MPMTREPFTLCMRGINHCESCFVNAFPSLPLLVLVMLLPAHPKLANPVLTLILISSTEFACVSAASDVSGNEATLTVWDDPNVSAMRDWALDMDVPKMHVEAVVQHVLDNFRQQYDQCATNSWVAVPPAMEQLLVLAVRSVTQDPAFMADVDFTDSLSSPVDQYAQSLGTEQATKPAAAAAELTAAVPQPAASDSHPEAATSTAFTAGAAQGSVTANLAMFSPAQSAAPAVAALVAVPAAATPVQRCSVFARLSNAQTPVQALSAAATTEAMVVDAEPLTGNVADAMDEDVDSAFAAQKGCKDVDMKPDEEVEVVMAEAEQDSSEADVSMADAALTAAPLRLFVPVKNALAATNRIQSQLQRLASSQHPLGLRVQQQQQQQPVNWFGAATRPAALGPLAGRFALPSMPQQSFSGAASFAPRFGVQPTAAAPSPPPGGLFAGAGLGVQPTAAAPPPAGPISEQSFSVHSTSTADPPPNAAAFQHGFSFQPAAASCSRPAGQSTAPFAPAAPTAGPQAAPHADPTAAPQADPTAAPPAAPTSVPQAAALAQAASSAAASSPLMGQHAAPVQAAPMAPGQSASQGPAAVASQATGSRAVPAASGSASQPATAHSPAATSAAASGQARRATQGAAAPRKAIVIDPVTTPGGGSATVSRSVGRRTARRSAKASAKASAAAAASASDAPASSAPGASGTASAPSGTAPAVSSAHNTPGLAANSTAPSSPAVKGQASGKRTHSSFTTADQAYASAQQATAASNTSQAGLQASSSAAASTGHTAAAAARDQKTDQRARAVLRTEACSTFTTTMAVLR